VSQATRGTDTASQRRVRGVGVWDQVAAEVLVVVVVVVGARGVADLRERGVLAGVGRSGVLRATEEERVETILGGMRLRTATLLGFSVLVAEVGFSWVGL